MNNQKDKGIKNRLEKKTVLDQFREILKADKFHRGNDIPAIKHQDQGKHDRKEDKESQVKDVWRNQEVGCQIMFFHKLKLI